MTEKQSDGHVCLRALPPKPNSEIWYWVTTIEAVIQI